jgi:hypothetical protein
MARVGLYAVGGLAVFAMALGALGLVVVGVDWYGSVRAAALREERAASWEASLDDLAARMRQLAEGEGADDPQVAAAVAERRRPHHYVAPSGDPLDEHLRGVMARITGQPLDQPLHGGFIAEVERYLLQVARDKETYCRFDAVRKQVVDELHAEFRRMGRPPEQADALVYIPWRESRYRTSAVGDQGRSKGMWQFMDTTAPLFDLPVQPVDWRCDWRKSTQAAARLLAASFERCGPERPFLAIASFNTGLGNSCDSRRIKKLPLAEQDLIGFYTHGIFPVEVTKHYVPAFAAASFVGEQYELALRVAGERLGRTVHPAVCPAEAWTLGEGPCR